MIDWWIDWLFNKQLIKSDQSIHMLLFACLFDVAMFYAIFNTTVSVIK